MSGEWALACVSGMEANIGLIRVEMKSAADKLNKALGLGR